MLPRSTPALARLVVLALLLSAGVGCSGSSGSGKGDGDKPPEGMDEAKLKAARAGVRDLTEALAVYHTDHGNYPATLEELSVQSERRARSGVGPYAAPAALTDPWGKPFQFDPSGPTNKGKRPDVFTTAPGGELIGNWGALREKKPQEKPLTGTVSGNVSFQGQPLTGGTVSFVTGQGKIVIGLIRPDGSYELKGVPAGEVRVGVSTKVGPAPMPPKGTEKPAKEGPAARHVKIPPKYADPQTSGISYRVVGGIQEFDVRLVD